MTGNALLTTVPWVGVGTALMGSYEVIVYEVLDASVRYLAEEHISSALIFR